MFKVLSDSEVRSGIAFAREILSQFVEDDFWGIQQKYKSNCLGYGCFSVVMRHPELEDVAVKISVAPLDGGVLYAYWARE